MKINNLILELNSVCNNNCRYCYLDDRSHSGSGSLGYFKDKLTEYSNQCIQNVDFTGGEPTLYRDLQELVISAKQLNYHNLSLVTNGRMLSRKAYARALVDAGINRVVITLDGPNAEIAENLTQVPGSFSQTLDGIKNVKELGCEIGITFVVTKLNFVHLPETAELAFKLGANFFGIQYMLPYIDDANVDCRKMEPSIIPTYSEVEPYTVKVLNLFANKKINVHFIPFCQLQGYEEFLDPESLKEDRYAINFRGYGYNIGEHLSKGAKKLKRCKKCKFADRCKGFYFSYAKELGVDL